MRKIILTIAAIALPTLVAADAVTDAVKARQEHMKAYGKQMQTFAAMAKGETEYDPAVAQAAADTLVALVNEDTSALWVPNSSSDDLPGVSKARPELWENFEKAGAIGAEMKAAAATMQQVAANGKGEMAQALGEIGKTCQSCHKAFQVKED